MADSSPSPDQNITDNSAAGTSTDPAAVHAPNPDPRAPGDRPTDPSTQSPRDVEPAGAPDPHSDIDLLLRQAEEAIASVDAAPETNVQGASPFQLNELSGTPMSTEATTIDLIRDVELDLRIELGRSQMELEDVLKLRRGSVVTLDKLAGDPVDVYVNGRIIARGEVLVLNDNFCVRVTELVAGDAV